MARPFTLCGMPSENAIPTPWEEGFEPWLSQRCPNQEHARHWRAMRYECMECMEELIRNAQEVALRRARHRIERVDPECACPGNLGRGGCIHVGIEMACAEIIEMEGELG